MNSYISLRTRKLVEKCLLADVDDNLSEAEHSDPFATGDSSDEYIPSSSDLSSDNESVYLSPNNKPEEQTNLAANRSKSPIINIISDIIITKPRKMTLEIISNYNQACLVQEVTFEAQPYEFDNSFRNETLIYDDNTIRRLRTFFENKQEIDKRKQITKQVEKSVYDSPLLIKNKYKKTVCKFCDQSVVSRHFARHLERRHRDEVEVKEIMNKKPKSKEKKDLVSLIRNQGCLDDGLRGKIIPKKYKLGEEVNERDFAICKYCKGFFKRLYLSRHVKKCFAKPPESNDVSHPLTESYIYVACQKKYGEVLNKLRVKKEVFERMQADDITQTASNDILIIYYGEDLLKKIKMKRRFYHISNKLRECAKFLIEMKKMKPFENLISVVKPENFDYTIDAVKALARYDIDKRNFGAASLALHFRTILTNLCDLTIKLILRRKIPHFHQEVDKTLIDLERFKNLVDTQWATEIGSLALKDLNEKSSMKPKLLPITEDIIKLARLIEDKAKEAYRVLLNNKKDIVSYRILVETVLVATILHNRKRVGDVQYLEYNSLKEQFETKNCSLHTELANSLTENEKILTNNYKSIVSIGKGSRPVTILIPKKMFNFYKLLITVRTELRFPIENCYFFTYPESKFWIDGCSVIRKYANLSNAKYPNLLTSCKLRKHIATVTQLLNLQSNEVDQLAKFMGHTTKTHESFYKLPQDVYQIAKVSKILQIMEKGNAADFKNKTLEEIDVDMNELESVLEEDDQMFNPNTSHILGIKESVTQNTDEHELAREEQDNSDRQEIKSEEFELHLEQVDNTGQAMQQKKTTKKGSRKRWSPIQKKLMKKYFRKQLQIKKALRKEECENFIKAYPSDFEGVEWIRIKTFIFNECKSSKI